MKQTRKSVFLMLVIALSVSLAACGGSDEEPLVVIGNNNSTVENNATENNVVANNDSENNSVEQPDLIDTIPEFYLAAESEDDYGKTEPNITTIADSSHQIVSPRDLEFHPFEDRKNELWVINRGTSMRGGNTVTLYDAGTDDMAVDSRRDGNAWHFMQQPTALAFSDNGNWATGTGVQDNNQDGGTFAGPSMWSSDMDIYAMVGDPPTAQVNGSHLDMLHGSPFSMGVAHQEDNIFWIYDGYHGYIVRYDFNEAHYPGGWDHSDGRIHRYTEVEIERHETVPSHMVVDKDTGWLYINDTGNKRIIRMDTSTGEKLSDLELINEELQEHWEVQNVTWEVFVEEGLEEPSGIAFVDGRLFVGDHATGDIIAYDVEEKVEIARVNVGAGIKGLTIGPDNKLWFVNHSTSQVLRLDPQ